MTRRGFLVAAGAAGLSLGIYSESHARHELMVKTVPIKIRDLPDAFLGFRIAQISDIHLEEYTEPWFLEQTVQRVNGLKPDLVLFTGDLISTGPGPFSLAHHAAGVAAEILSGLKAPQRFAITGNHDDAVGVAHVVAPLESHGTPVLLDSYVPLERSGDRIWLCGTRDLFWNTPDLTKTFPVDRKSPVILMAHEPDFVDHLVKHPLGRRIDLMLSGHTHGGQIRLPWIGPFNLPVLGRKYVRGHFLFGEMQLYVNQGIGTAGLPLRLNCPPEITEIVLQRA